MSRAASLGSGLNRFNRPLELGSAKHMGLACNAQGVVSGTADRGDLSLQVMRYKYSHVK